MKPEIWHTNMQRYRWTLCFYLDGQRHPHITFGNTETAITWLESKALDAPSGMKHELIRTRYLCAWHGPEGIIRKHYRRNR